MRLMEMPFETEGDKKWFNDLFKKSEKRKVSNMPKRLKIKVCGMRDQQNVMDVMQTGIDFMGFIFYGKSKRYVGETFDSMIPQWAKSSVKTVGVFVNEKAEDVLHTVRRYNLDYVQLHGDESVEYCNYLQAEGVRIIKAFGVDDSFDFGTLNAYESVVDYFLFDTKSMNYGGTGRKFNWEMLNKYQLSKPFFLSGGIGPLDAETILEYEHPRLAGIDLNSKFELAPAKKDANLLDAFNTIVRKKNRMSE